MSLVGQDDIQVPSELLWRLLIHRQMEDKCKELKLDDLETLIADFNTTQATGALIERYDIPKYWFERLVQEGGNRNPVEFKSSTSHKDKRRKTWGQMLRDLSIYMWRQQGKSIGEIWRLLREETGEDLDYGNIKKIESNVRHTKLGVGEQVALEPLKTSGGKRRTTHRLEHVGFSD